MQERLQKVLARAGVASRRKAEELITGGRVEVNGRRVTELGTRVDTGRDAIRVDGRLVADIAERIYYVLYKPIGCVTTLSDPEGRPSLAEFVRRLPERVYPVGRLDYDAEGAVILTNDGELAHRLMHPRFGARRTYLAKVRGSPPAAALARMTEGVRLEDGMARALEAQVVSRALRNTWIRLVLAEGRPHLVKRLCEAVEHPVQRLYRPDYAGVSVEGMGPGELRELSASEVRRLRSAVEGGGQAPRQGPAPTLPPRRHGAHAPASRGESRPTVLRSAREAAAEAPRRAAPKSTEGRRQAPSREAPDRGPRTTGSSRGGAPRGGAPRNGAPRNGAPRGGATRGEAPRGEATRRGPSRGEATRGEAPRGEATRGEATRRGPFRGGAARGGVARGEGSRGGAARGSPRRSGAPRSAAGRAGAGPGRAPSRPRGPTRGAR